MRAACSWIESSAVAGRHHRLPVIGGVSSGLPDPGCHDADASCDHLVVRPAEGRGLGLWARSDGSSGTAPTQELGPFNGFLFSGLTWKDRRRRIPGRGIHRSGREILVTCGAPESPLSAGTPSESFSFVPLRWQRGRRRAGTSATAVRVARRME